MYAEIITGRTKYVAWISIMETKPELLSPGKRITPVSNVLVSVVIMSKE